MKPDGVADLIAWVENGGALLGFHSAADTFHDPSGAPSPYVRLLGGEFLTHGRQFPGKLRIVDTDHPTMAHVPQDWTLMEEWYAFKNMNVDRVHVLALLDTSSDPYKQEAYKREPYPVIWCASVGKGRVFYNAMGHREETWDDPKFQQAFVDALYWAVGKTPLDAEPNFKVVVPSPGSSGALTAELARLRHLREPAIRRLGRARARLVVHSHQPEALAIALGPLEVVEDRPHEVAAQVDSLLDRFEAATEMLLQVLDSIDCPRPTHRATASSSNAAPFSVT